MLNFNAIYQGDCLELMKEIPDGSVDFVLTDLPYGTTNCHFDKKIDLEKFWVQIKRVIKFNAAIALFSQMPFGAELIMSNRKMFRYEWIWEKNLACGFLNANKMPLRAHENILIFYQKLPTYNPQFSKGKSYYRTPSNVASKNYNKNFDKFREYPERRFPQDILSINAFHFAEHPQEKPVDLLEYLIKTYSNEGEVILDATIGSGSTAVAAINTNRQFIGFELDEHNFDIACDRIQRVQDEKQLSLLD